MECPSCGSRTRTLESRRAEGGAVVRRRRECTSRSCGRRFTSFERREPEPAFVIKRTGERQPFDRVKLRASLLRAAHKRPVTAADIERLVDSIEREAEESGGEIAAERVGDLCLTGLRELDANSWLQFLTVYRELGDIDSVRAELDRIEAAAVPGKNAEVPAR
jgi:transcriptional repressor NrdR